MGERPDIQERVDSIVEDRLRRHVQALAGIGPRVPADPEAGGKTLQYIRSQLEAAGYRPTIEDAGLYVAGDGRAFEQANVLAELPGAEPGTVIELGAHHDTVAGTPGADDNASGVAGVLEAARALSGARCRKTVRFCFFCLEEYGWGGSRAHVERIRTAGERFEGILVLEMVGYATRAPRTQRTPARIPLILWPPTTGDFIAVVGNLRSGGIGNRFERAARRYAPQLKYYSVNRIGGFFGDAVRSDHYPYWQSGYRGVMLTDTANFRNPHYHRPGDLPDTLDYAFLAGVTRAAAAALLEWGEME